MKVVKLNTDGPNPLEGFTFARKFCCSHCRRTDFPSSSAVIVHILNEHTAKAKRPVVDHWKIP